MESAVAKFAEKQQTVRKKELQLPAASQSQEGCSSVSQSDNIEFASSTRDVKEKKIHSHTDGLLPSEATATASTANSSWSKSPKKDFHALKASSLLGSQLFAEDSSDGALNDMRKHYIDFARGPSKLPPPPFLPPHHPAFDFLRPPPTAAGFDLVRQLGGPTPFSMPYFSPLQIPSLPPLYTKEPEQTEALPLIVNTPKKKRTKVTDTRLSPRAARALLQEPSLGSNTLRTSGLGSGSYDYPFHSSGGSHHSNHYHGHHHSHRRSPGEMSDSRPRSNPAPMSGGHGSSNDLSPDNLFSRGHPFVPASLAASAAAIGNSSLQQTDVFSALYKHHAVAAAVAMDQRSPFVPFGSVLGLDGKRESDSPRSGGDCRRGGESLLQQQLADENEMYDQDASSSESYTIVSFHIDG